MMELWHIIDRYFYHYGWAILFVGIFSYALYYWIQHNKKVRRWIAPEPERLYVVSAILVSNLFPLREPIDLIMGNQSNIKTLFDYLSWYMGAASGAWWWYRVQKFYKTKGK